MTDAHPTVRLKPKTDPRRIRRGFPWVYASELVTDRRTKALARGTIATLEDAERRPLATVTVNPDSKIFARVMEADPDAPIDAAWISARLVGAAALRDRLYREPFYRLAHAEADGLPGVVIDRFGDTAVVQPNAAWAEAMLGDIVTALNDLGIANVVKNAQGRARSLEGLDDVSAVVAGRVDGPIEVPMNGAIYIADLLGGQKTGLFYDQRPNHAFVAGLARGLSVLDVFSHVGGFALAALAGGAASALSVDGSAPALALAEQGAKASGFEDRFETRRGDAFDVLKALADKGESYGVVVCDPPAFASHKGALDAGLRAYEKVARLSAGLVLPGGFLTLCSCSHAVDIAKFRDASLRGVGKAGRRAQVLHTGFAGPDHPQHPHLAESGYLKAITLRIDP